MDPVPHRLLGQILTDGGYVTLAQLGEARRRQMRGRGETERRIGEILVEMGHLAPEALARALTIQEAEGRGAPA